MFLLIGILVGVLGALPILAAENSTKNKLQMFIPLSIFYALISWWLFWKILPSIAYPLFGGYAITVTIFMIITVLLIALISEGEDIKLSWVLPTILILILLGISIGGAKIFNAGKYSSLIGTFDTKNQKHWSQEIQPLDPTHLRLVPEEVALFLARTALTADGNTLGSQFPLHEEFITLQKVNEEYVYLIPLDYKRWKVWTNAKANGVPGYVRISATDPYAKPELVMDKHMKYMPNGYFSTYLKRHLYKKYSNKILADFSFEEDDNKNIYWVISVAKPTIAFKGKVVEGVILVNPETGEDTFLTVNEVNSNPKYSWIDRVYPREIVEQYIDYWGSLKDGWWNSFWSEINILESETPTVNYSSDNKCVFVAPVTSSTEGDESMSGLMYCDARTGKFTYYTTSGGATESDIVNAVNAAVKYKAWQASEQIVYENVYGHTAALVPVLGANGTYQSLAIVRTDNREVALGETPQEALIEFQKVIMNTGGQITTDNAKELKKLTAVVKRMGWELSTTGKQYYIYFSEKKNSFMISSNTTLQSELALTKEGDQVSITYYDSPASVVPVTSFRNITLNLQSSENEKAVEMQMITRRDSTQNSKDIKDFRESIKNLSDQDIQEILQKQKENK